MATIIPFPSMAARQDPYRPKPKGGYASAAELAAAQVWEEINQDTEWLVRVFQGEFDSGREDVKEAEYLEYRRSNLGDPEKMEDWLAQVGPEVFIDELWLALDLPKASKKRYIELVADGVSHDQAVDAVNQEFNLLPPPPPIPDIFMAPEFAPVSGGIPLPPPGLAGPPMGSPPSPSLPPGPPPFPMGGPPPGLPMPMVGV